MGEQPLRVGYPSLFAICSNPMLLVASAAHEGTWNIAIRRTFGMEEATAWVELRARLPPSLSTSIDSVAWRLTPSGIFSVSSAYRALFRGPSLPWTTPLWKAPLPLKTKILVWQLLRDRLPSGVEVAKRHGQGDELCPLCRIPESGTHMMFTCPATQFLWSFVLGGPGSCMGGSGPWRVTTNPSIFLTGMERGVASSGSCSLRCLGPYGLRAITWLLRKYSLDVLLTRCLK
jgi:hypothetical protein